MTTCDLIVVGAGIGGLSSAYALQQAGLKVVVIEAQPQVGGALWSERTREGFLLEHGPNTVAGSDPLLDGHFAALGISDLKLTAARSGAKRYVVHRGQLKLIPLSPPAMLKSDLISLRGKLRMLAELWLPPTPVDQSIAAFFTRRLGAEPFARLIDPFISGVYAGDPAALSVAAAFPRFWQAEQAHGSLVRGMIAAQRAAKRSGVLRRRNELFSFRPGLGTWPQAIALALGAERVWCDSRAVGLQRHPEGWEVTVERAGTAHVLLAPQVILATPAHVTAQLLAVHDEPAAKALAGLVYPPLALVHLGYQRSAIAHPFDGFGMLCPADEQRGVLGTLWPSALFPGRAPVEHVLTTSFIGGARYPEAARQSDADLIATAHREQQALIGARAEPVFSRVVRWAQAIPQYHAGHRERVALLDAAEGRLPGLYLSSNYRDGVAVERCWQRGREVAARALERHQHAVHA